MNAMLASEGPINSVIILFEYLTIIYFQDDPDIIEYYSNLKENLLDCLVCVFTFLKEEKNKSKEMDDP